jgi:hypothetical protein
MIKQKAHGAKNQVVSDSRNVGNDYVAKLEAKVKKLQTKAKGLNATVKDLEAKLAEEKMYCARYAQQRDIYSGILCNEGYDDLVDDIIKHWDAGDYDYDGYAFDPDCTDDDESDDDDAE